MQTRQIIKRMKAICIKDFQIKAFSGYDIIIYKKDEIKLLQFHKFSLIVWIIWLIPMITGMIYGSSM